MDDESGEGGGGGGGMDMYDVAEDDDGRWE